MPIKEKVLVYITWRGKLLTFTQPKFPDAGRQVVAGTVEPGEALEIAALREAREETGLECFTEPVKLGEFYYSMEKFGRSEIQFRHVYHLQCSDDELLMPSWFHHEETPSNSTDSIEFYFEWLSLDNSMGTLIGGHDFFIPMLLHRVKEWFV